MITHLLVFEICLIFLTDFIWYIFIYLYNCLDQQGGQDLEGEGDGTDSGSSNPDGENRQEGDGTDNQPNADGDQPNTNGQSEVEGGANNGTDTSAPSKKGMTWLPIIIIGASILGLLIIGLIVLLIRKKRSTKGYNPAATGEQPASTRA